MALAGSGTRLCAKEPKGCVGGGFGGESPLYHVLTKISYDNDVRLQEGLKVINLVIAVSHNEEHIDYINSTIEKVFGTCP